MTVESLHEQINLELKRFCSEHEAYTWLRSPQALLGLRVPARMMATDEGHAVLEALRRFSPTHPDI